MARNTNITADANAPPVTRILAKFVATHPSRGWSDAVEHEAQRTLLNWVGCAIGASRHATVEAALAAVTELAPAPQASALGRGERVDIASAALLNGITSHTFDFDDTHLKTIIHPAGPVASAAAGARRTPAARRARSWSTRWCSASTSRAASATRSIPDHYDRGWHITGSTGMLGAAAACARLLGLDGQQTAMALGIAASQPVGVREQFGTMTKPFHPGAAARAGLMSALLAQARLHGVAARARSAARPAADVFGQVRLARDHRRARRALRDFVQHLQAVRVRHRRSIRRSTAACSCAMRTGSPRRTSSASISRVHPLVLELTGKTAPRTGLEGKFSVYHACAAGLVFGRAGEGEFADDVVARDRRRRAARTRPRDGRPGDRRGRRGRDDSLHGRPHAPCAVAHAVGSLERPMSDDDLARKFRGLVDPVLGADRAMQVQALCARLGSMPDLRALFGSVRPGNPS